MPPSVLIVDDDPAFRGLAARILAASGLSVAGEASDVAEAIEAAERLRPDAALVDIGLPDGSGIDLARELAALPWSPRIVLTSTDENAADGSEVGDGGRLEFVPKDQLPNAPLGSLLG